MSDEPPNAPKCFVLSSSPTSLDSASPPPQSPGRSLDRTISPSFGSGEIDVVLDDGTLERRKVSLTSIADPETTADHTTPLLANAHPTMYMSHHSSVGSTTSSSSGEDNDDSSSDEDDIDDRPKGYPLIWPQFDARQKRVLKCSFAYFFASLFTFVPMLNELIGHNRRSSHLVATATVFFNPAKTLGGMVEAAAFGWGYTLFALTVCLGSMITTDFFVDRNLYGAAHSISLLFWLAGATWTVSFLKAYWNKPPVATASSLCFIIIFIIVVREGSANRGDFDISRISEITSAVATGTIITVLCCIFFWPESAVTKLKKDIEATLVSYRVLLKLLTKTFLLDDDLPQFEANSELQQAIESHRSSFTSLQKSLKEAKLEMGFGKDSMERAKQYDDIIFSMHRLAQYVGGLRSSCGIQFERLGGAQGAKQAMSAGLHTSNRRRKPEQSGSDGVWNIRAGYHRRKFQEEMRRQKTMLDDHQHHLHRSMSTPHSTARPAATVHPTAHEEERTSLAEFIQTIRQPLKSLAYTCKRTLYHLETDFEGKNTKKLEHNMSKALALFEVSQRQAVRSLYRHHHAGPDNGIVYVPREDSFLVYFFLFNMVEFAHELIHLVDAVDKLARNPRPQDDHGRWWLIWTRKRVAPFSHTIFPNERNTVATLHTPVPQTAWRRFMRDIWLLAETLKQQKIRYAIKATVAAILLALPAFLDSTGPWFREWRMEWALITLMVVMTPTVGGTNIVALYRVLSTALGVSAAAIFYRLFPANVFVLPILTWLFSIPNFWVILYHKHGKFGRFTLLAYNLVMLNKYNDREENTIAVEWLALQRFLAILVGVVVGLFVTSYVWPFEARVELRKGISDLLIHLAWVYRKLLATYAEPDSGDHQALTIREERHVATQNFMSLELEIQRTLTELSVLLAQAPNEFRLKGPFPTESYRLMLRSCRNIADKFLAMRTVIFKDAWIEQVHQDFILPVNQERKEMAGNILLYFYLLASALRLKTPLPPHLPPARAAWKRLLARLREIPVVKSQQVVERDNVYTFYYAYVTMMEDVIRELDKLGDNMRELFGALVPQEDWERLFPEEEQ